MFVLCPHCQFLVATDPASGQSPSRCTRCDGWLMPESIAAPTATAAAPMPEPRLTVAADARAGDTPQARTRDDDAAAAMTAPVGDDAEVRPPADIESKALPAPAIAAPEARAEPDTAAPQALPGPAAGAAGAGGFAPGFVRRQQLRIARAPHVRGGTIGLIAALSLLLVLQLVLADRAALARDARWRPALTLLCATLRCSLPPWREPAAFTLLDRNVQPRPDQPGVLRVTATFRNDARWPQPWPALLLTLSDLDGRVAGARLFAPREYLGALPGQPVLASGQSAMLAMDVVEPGPRVIAFTFDFR